MLHPAAHFRIRPVHPVLTVAQSLRTRRLVIDAGFVTALSQLPQRILRTVGTVGPYLTIARGPLRQQLNEHLRVVRARRRHLPFVNELRLPIRRDVVLVAEMVPVALFRPARIGVLLAQPVRIVLPGLRHLAGLHRPVVLAAVALTGNLDNR